MASPLTRAHIEAERRLRVLTKRAIEAIWADMPSYDRADLDQWLSRVLPLVDTAQRQSVALTEAYLARYMGRQPLGLNPSELTGAAVRNGTPPTEVYERPFVTLWSALGDGLLFDDAAGKALARATGAAAMDTQLSMRATTRAVDQADPNIYGYRRVANPSACAFCQEVDGAYVKGNEGFVMALHPGCECSVEPNEVPPDLAVYLPDGTRVHPRWGPKREWVPLKLDNTAVRTHGELGPILGDPNQNFTSEADLAHSH